MLKLFKFFIWIIVVLALAVGFDQFMVRTPLNVTGLKETQIFYVDFRQRLIRLINNGQRSASDDIQAVIERSNEQKKVEEQSASRFVYVDRNGELQFADSLKDVPAEYRENAQPMAD